jgi:hypothetical protein
MQNLVEHKVDFASNLPQAMYLIFFCCKNSLQCYECGCIAIFHDGLTNLLMGHKKEKPTVPKFGV